jgi:hypothetical protein
MTGGKGRKLFGGITAESDLWRRPDLAPSAQNHHA